MKKNINKSKVIAVSLGVLGFMMIFSPISKAGTFEPGSEDDPIVTQGYVEKRNEQLKYYIDQKIEEIKVVIGEGNEQSNSTTPTAEVQGTSFVVVQLEKGQRLVGGEGTELILRAGEANAIDSQSGGLANVTNGKDLRMGDKVDLNNLLLIPRNDGRGIIAKSNIYVMVKGSYTIQ
ncbi:hypothetical protein QBE52_13890 [Clostridiaceae bacterium 35-E11]